MATEIERKFLVHSMNWKTGVTGTLFRQGYLCTDPERTLRVRLEGDRGKLTVKGKNRGICRTEFEYEIPASEAAAMLDELCLKPLVEKTRYRIMHAGHLWEVDEFHGDNEGLVLAEIELNSEETAVELPDWAGAEVSEDVRYYNSYLVLKPFKHW